MIILPAIDLFGGQAVRLYQGDYNQMTVYDADPLHTVAQFEAAGATHLHLVDLEGAKTGQTTNLPTIERIAAQTGLFVEVGGGIRNMDTVRRYLDAGASRVILGTAAVTDPDFTARAVAEYGDKIAVGADLKDGKVAIKGWLETSQTGWEAFFDRMERLGGKTIIGQVAKWSGPDGMFGANALTESLRQAGLTLRRFKTGTPPRVNARSIDFSQLERQEGDGDAEPFSFTTEAIAPNRVCCYITYTNEKTHEIIRANLDRSPLFSGVIQGVGPRYCPSIEDKVVRFAD